MTKFQITIDQDHLGGVLAALPFGVNPEIVRLKDSPARIKKATNGHAKQNGPALFDITALLSGVPANFSGKEFAAAINQLGGNANSYSHFLRRAMEGNLVRKVKRGVGRKQRYEKVISSK